MTLYPHVVKENGDCPVWCSACQIRRWCNLPLDCDDNIVYTVLRAKCPACANPIDGETIRDYSGRIWHQGCVVQILTQIETRPATTGAGTVLDWKWKVGGAV